MSIVKELLYKKALERELQNKYDEGRYGNQCSACGNIETIEKGILIKKHYRRCPTGQIERLLKL